jgi:hypothetical protein
MDTAAMSSWENANTVEAPPLGATASDPTIIVANLTALIDSTQDPLWSVDLYHRLVTLNKAFRVEVACTYSVQATVGMVCDRQEENILIGTSHPTVSDHIGLAKVRPILVEDIRAVCFNKGNRQRDRFSTIYGPRHRRQSGGWVDVWSDLGEGTTFKMYFPCIDAIPAQSVRPRSGVRRSS